MGREEFECQWANPPFSEDWRLESNAPSRRRQGSLEAEPPALKILYAFGKNNLGLKFDKN